MVLTFSVFMPAVFHSVDVGPILHSAHTKKIQGSRWTVRCIEPLTKWFKFDSVVIGVVGEKERVQLLGITMDPIVLLYEIE